MIKNLNTIIKEPGKHVLSNELMFSVLKLNEANLPALGSLGTIEKVSDLFALSSCFYLVFYQDELIAFLVLMDEKSGYQSPNYRFFKSTHKQFNYIDRVAVSSQYQRKGIGTYLYNQITTLTKSQKLCCEVNTVPMNKSSFDFHHKIGFKVIEERPFGDKKVAMMMK